MDGGEATSVEDGRLRAIRHLYTQKMNDVVDCDSLKGVKDADSRGKSVKRQARRALGTLLVLLVRLNDLPASPASERPEMQMLCMRELATGKGSSAGLESKEAWLRVLQPETLAFG